MSTFLCWLFYQVTFVLETKSIFIFSLFKAVLFGFSFANVAVKSESDFLSSTLSGERTPFLLLTFPLVSESNLGKWLVPLSCGAFAILQF